MLSVSKVNGKDTRMTSIRCGVYIGNFERSYQIIQHITSVFLLATLNMYLHTV